MRTHIRVGSRAFRRDMSTWLERVASGDVIEIVSDGRRKDKRVRAVVTAPKEDA